MKNYTNSDYAANKNASGIVYRFANETIEVTLKDYLRESPGKTAADFAELKAISDSDYYERDRSEYRQTWKNIILDGLEEVLKSPGPSPEDEVIAMPEQAAVLTQKREMAMLALGKLTDVQRRRYLMYHVQGQTVREIAAKEGTYPNAIQESLQTAERKIKKILTNG